MQMGRIAPRSRLVRRVVACQWRSVVAGVPTDSARHARTAREAADAAADLGFPVVLKILFADIFHKSDIGGVRLGVSDHAAPFDEAEARAMIEQIVAFSVLRGQPPADLADLAAALSRLSLFAAANADTIESLDLNPFLVRPSSALALDAVLVTRPHPVTTPQAPSDPRWSVLTNWHAMPVRKKSGTVV